MSDGTSNGMSNGMLSETYKSEDSQSCQNFEAHLRDTKIMSALESSKISHSEIDESRVMHTSDMVGMDT